MSERDDPTPSTPNTVQIPSPLVNGYSGATLHLVIDPAEHARRQAASIGPATGHGFGGLGTLMTLPEGLPVPVSALTYGQQRYVRNAPAGICTIDNEYVTRHAIRPCRVTLATVRANSASQSALESADRFTPFCPRQVIIRRTPTLSWLDHLLEFGSKGIGVVLEHPDGSTEPLAEPRPWRPKQHTFEEWWFAEQAYAAYLEHTPATATPQPEARPRPEGTRR